MPRKQKIIIHNSTTTNITPSLSKAEIGVNITDQKFYVGNTYNNSINLSPTIRFISSTRYESSTTGITAPINAVILEIIGCGGGGGGGSGVVTSSAGGIGGGGGQGGQGGRLLVRLDDFGITSSTQLGITIGRGGTGGTAAQGSGTIAYGSDGKNGESTYVYLTSTGQQIVEFPGGQGGIASTTTNLRPYRCMRSSFSGMITGPGGQPANQQADATARLSTFGGNALYGGGGGGGGGVVRSDTGRVRNPPSNGGSSNTFYVGPGITTSGGSGGWTSSSPHGGEGKTTIYGGGGGGGGFPINLDFHSGGLTAGGNGGTGATGGGGGGGGGMAGSTSGVANSNHTSGIGGNGGSGYVILRWW